MVNTILCELCEYLCELCTQIGYPSWLIVLITNLVLRGEKITTRLSLKYSKLFVELNPVVIVYVI